MKPLEVARAWRREGRYDLGLACLAELPEDGAVRAERARLLVRLGRAAEARREAEAAVSTAGSQRLEALLALTEAAVAGGDTGAARAAVEEAVPLAREEHGEVSLATALALVARATSLHTAGDAAGALAPATRALAILEQIGADATFRAEAQHALAEAWHRAGEHGSALEAWKEALALRRAHLEADHPEIADALNGLGLTLRRLGRLREAIAAHSEALALHRARLGPWHPGVAAGLHGLAQALHRTGDFQGARERLREALEVSERVLGADHPDGWVTRFELGRISVDCGDFDGFARMEEARERLRAVLGAGHPTVAAMNRWL